MCQPDCFLEISGLYSYYPYFPYGTEHILSGFDTVQLQAYL